VESVQPAWQDAVFVGGEFRRAADGGTIGVRDKASGEIFANAGLAGATDVADAVAYIVTRPRRVAVNEIVVRPTEQLE